MEGSLSSKYHRTPKNYNGTGITTRRMNELLPHVLRKIQVVYQHRPDLILASWPEIIGQKLASMTLATAFTDGILHIKVRNSTLYSLLSQHDKPQILAKLREKFPDTQIKGISFRIG